MRKVVWLFFLPILFLVFGNGVYANTPLSLPVYEYLNVSNIVSGTIQNNYFNFTIDTYGYNNLILSYHLYLKRKIQRIEGSPSQFDVGYSGGIDTPSCVPSTGGGYVCGTNCDSSLAGALDVDAIFGRGISSYARLKCHPSDNYGYCHVSAWGWLKLFNNPYYIVNVTIHFKVIPYAPSSTYSQTYWGFYIKIEDSIVYYIYKPSGSTIEIDRTYTYSTLDDAVNIQFVSFLRYAPRTDMWTYIYPIYIKEAYGTIPIRNVKLYISGNKVIDDKSLYLSNDAEYTDTIIVHPINGTLPISVYNDFDGADVIFSYNILYNATRNITCIRKNNHHATLYICNLSLDKKYYSKIVIDSSKIKYDEYYIKFYNATVGEVNKVGKYIELLNVTSYGSEIELTFVDRKPDPYAKPENVTVGQVYEVVVDDWINTTTSYTVSVFAGKIWYDDQETQTCETLEGELKHCILVWRFIAPNTPQNVTITVTTSDGRTASTWVYVYPKESSEIKITQIANLYEVQRTDTNSFNITLTVSFPEDGYYVLLLEQNMYSYIYNGGYIKLANPNVYIDGIKVYSSQTNLYSYSDTDWIGVSSTWQSVYTLGVIYLGYVEAGTHTITLEHIPGSTVVYDYVDATYPTTFKINAWLVYAPYYVEVQRQNIYFWLDQYRSQTVTFNIQDYGTINDAKLFYAIGKQPSSTNIYWDSCDFYIYVDDKEPSIQTVWSWQSSKNFYMKTFFGGIIDMKPYIIEGDNTFKLTSCLYGSVAVGSVDKVTVMIERPEIVITPYMYTIEISDPTTPTYLNVTVELKNIAPYNLTNVTLYVWYPYGWFGPTEVLVGNIPQGSTKTITLNVTINPEGHIYGVNTITLFAKGDNGISNRAFTYVTLYEEKQVKLEVEHPIEVPAGTKFYIRVRYKLTKGTKLEYPFIGVDWDGTFAYATGRFAGDPYCISPDNITWGDPQGRRVGILDLLYMYARDIFGLTGKQTNYKIEKAILKVGPVKNLYTGTRIYPLFSVYFLDTNHKVLSELLAHGDIIAPTVDLSAFLTMIPINNRTIVYLTTLYAQIPLCKYHSAKMYEPSAQLIIYYRSTKPDTFEPIGEWFKYGETVSYDQWSSWYSFQAVAPTTPGLYNITVVLQDQLETDLVWTYNFTLKVVSPNVSSVIPIIRWETPDKYYVGEPAEVKGELKVINTGQALVPLYTVHVYVPYGENFKVTEKDTGKVIFERDTVSGIVVFQVKDLAPGITKEYDIRYEFPTAEVINTKKFKIVEGGQLIDVAEYYIKSEAHQVLPDVIFRTTVDCSLVNKVEIDGKEVRYSCFGSVLEVSLGTLDVGEVKKVKIYTYAVKEETIQPIVKAGKDIIDFVRENTVLVLGGLAALLFIIFLVI